MSAQPDVPDELLQFVGRVLDDRYRVDALLGVGGMGAVFRCRHLGLRKDVALKILRPAVAAGETMTKRFEREAQSASRLDHPNIVRVMDFGSLEDGAKYLVMQILEGEELKDTMGTPWPPAKAVDTVLQVLAGLDHAHHHGIVHRDLKPENVFVTRDHRGDPLIKLVDFGIAKVVEGDGADDKLTRTGMVFGTPRYMSPEQAAGGKIDARTDLYTVGLILYELLSGRSPFESDDASEMVRMQLITQPPPLPDPIPEPLVAIVDKLLAKSRLDRPDSAKEVISRLEPLRPGLEGLPAAAALPSATAETTPPHLVPAVLATPVVANPAVAIDPVADTPAADRSAPASNGPAHDPESRASVVPVAVAEARPARTMVPWAVAALALLIAGGSVALLMADSEPAPPSSPPVRATRPGPVSSAPAAAAPPGNAPASPSSPTAAAAPPATPTNQPNTKARARPSPKTGPSQRTKKSSQDDRDAKLEREMVEAATDLAREARDAWRQYNDENPRGKSKPKKKKMKKRKKSKP